jgi:hypothetical protein
MRTRADVRSRWPLIIVSRHSQLGDLTAIIIYSLTFTIALLFTTKTRCIMVHRAGNIYRHFEHLYKVQQTGIARAK